MQIQGVLYNLKIPDVKAEYQLWNLGFIENRMGNLSVIENGINKRECI